MVEYYLFAAFAAAILVALMLAARRIFRGGKTEEEDEYPAQIAERYIEERLDILEKIANTLKADVETQIQGSIALMERQEARMEEALAGFQRMLEERLPQEERFRITEEFITPAVKRKPLKSMDTERFLNGMAEPRMQNNSTTEKNSKVRRLYRQGYTIEQIAQELGASTGEVNLIIDLDAGAALPREAD